MSAARNGKIPIRSVRYLGTFPNHRTERWVMIGQDGGQSIPLGDGSLFVFSDTLLAATASVRPPRTSAPPLLAGALGSGGVFLANAAGVSRATDLRQALAEIAYFTDADGFPCEILPPLERERLQQIRFWPEHGVLLDGTVYLYYIGIQMVDPSSIWGFRTLGAGLATIDPATGRCERIWRRGDWRLWRRFGDDIHFGVQVLPAGGWLYVYGSVRRDAYHFAGLARVRPQQIAEPDAYELFAGPEPSWTQDPTRARELCLASADYSVSFNRYLGCYLMTHIDEYTKVLTLRTADAPWGPWGEPQAVTGVPHEPGSEMVYLGFEHPDFSQQNGQATYVSYCQPRFRNNSLVTVCFR